MPQWGFTSAILASYQRSEQALLLCMMEMVLQGISTRKVSEVTELLCGKTFSASTISGLYKEFDPAVKEFRERPLTGGYPFIVCDALYMCVHERAKVVSTGVMIALGINEQCHREVLGFDIIKNESTSGWKEFFQGLKARGLSGVKLITSDAHRGIKAAIQEEFPGVAWQRCQTHFSRNVPEQCPKSCREVLHRELTDMYNAPDLESCQQRRDEILKKWENKAPKAMKVMEEGFYDIISVYAFPAAARKKLRTSNPIERENEEIRRRERMLRIFPNKRSIIRIVGALLLERHHQFFMGRAVFSKDVLKEVHAVSPFPRGEGKQEAAA